MAHIVQILNWMVRPELFSLSLLRPSIEGLKISLQHCGSVCLLPVISLHLTNTISPGTVLLIHMIGKVSWKSKRGRASRFTVILLIVDTLIFFLFVKFFVCFEALLGIVVTFLSSFLHIMVNFIRSNTKKFCSLTNLLNM